MPAACPTWPTILLFIQIRWWQHLGSEVCHAIEKHVLYKFAGDWIRTADLWFRRWPHCQLSHNHCQAPGIVLDHALRVGQSLLRYLVVHLSIVSLSSLCPHLDKSIFVYCSPFDIHLSQKVDRLQTHTFNPYFQGKALSHTLKLPMYL